MPDAPAEDPLNALALAAARTCERAAATLRDCGAATEGLAAYEEPRRRLLRTRPARLRPLGRVWRLGALLLDGGGSLYAAGRATRAAERGRPGYQSQSREERREIAAAALRGGYEIGDPVNFDAVLLLGPAAPGSGGAPGGDPAPGDDLATASAAATAAAMLRRIPADAPIGVADGEVRVRWRPGAPLEGAATLSQYLDERINLLVNRPEA